MESLAIILVITSALFHALRDFLTKKSGDKFIFMLLFSYAAALYFLPLFLYYTLLLGFPSHPAGLFWLGASIVIHFLYWICLLNALTHGDLSHVYPIIRSSPALVLILSILLLHEDVSLLGAMGILTVTTGVYIINLKKWALSEAFRPFTALLHERAVLFAFLAFLCVSAYSISDKIGVQYMHPIQYIYFMVLAELLLFTPIILYTKGTKKIAEEWSKYQKSILLNGFLVIAGYTLILFAFTIERVSYVVGLRQLSIIFAVLLGGQLLKEKHKKLRIIAALLICTGSYLITIG